MGPIHYQWEKYQPSDGSWITPSNRVVNITSPELIFSVIREEDEGVYHCIVTNDDGSVVSDNATITVYGECSLLCMPFVLLYIVHNVPSSETQLGVYYLCANVFQSL